MAKKKEVQCPQIIEVQDKKSKKQRSPRVIKTAVLGVVIGLMASAIAGLSVALYYSTVNVRTHESYQRQMDAVYFRTYYDLIDGANDLGISLKKLGVSTSPKMQQSLLYEVWSAASLAENDLGTFQSEGDGLKKAQKFINQLGDYSHALAIRVSDGKPLSAEEREKLVKLGEIAEAYLSALEKIKEDVDGGKLFVGDGGALEGIEDAFSRFAEPDFAYPEMIYDGPFSDALEGRTPVALTGEEISPEEGEQIVKKYFGAQDVTFAGEGKGDISTLNYTFRADGGEAFVQLGKMGGRVITFNMSSYDAPAVRQEAGATCQEAAIAYAEKLGFHDMRTVWSSSADGECVVNLAPVQDGVVLYPDLVKVKLSESDSRVIGFDATHYAFNHKPRELASPALTSQQAESRLSVPPVREGRLALIPMRGTKEALCFEFECESGGTYFVYIDALTGKEANILYVIDSESQGMRTA